MLFAIDFALMALLIIPTPIVHKNMLNIVTKTLAYKSPSAPNIAVISGKPMYAQLEKPMANCITLLSLDGYFRVTKNAITTLTAKTKVLSPKVFTRFGKMSGLNSCK